MGGTGQERKEKNRTRQEDATATGQLRASARVSPVPSPRLACFPLRPLAGKGSRRLHSAQRAEAAHELNRQTLRGGGETELQEGKSTEADRGNRLMSSRDGDWSSAQTVPRGL